MKYINSNESIDHVLQNVNPNYLTDVIAVKLLDIINLGDTANEMLQNGLTMEEEIDYRTYVKYAEKARKLIIESYESIIKNYISWYRHLSINDEDLKNAAYLGLLKAIKKFDINRGTSFRGYAKNYIKAEIIEEIANTFNVITIPKDVRANISRVKKIRGKLKQELWRDPTDQEIGLELGMKDENVAFYSSLGKGIYFLDKDLGDVYYLIIDDSDNYRPDKYTKKKIIEMRILICLEKLEPRNKRIIEMHFGLFNDEALTHKEISEVFDITPERVGQIIKESIVLLKKYYEENY